LVVGSATATEPEILCYPASDFSGDKMLRLEKPAPDLYPAFQAMSADYRRAGESRYQQEAGWTETTFGQYLQQLTDQEAGLNLPPNKTPQITSWRLRLELNDDLRNEGGNVGYDVPPSKRRCGYGTELLRLTLRKAQELGLKRVLVTCNKDNLGSRRIIEANGGIFASEGISTKYGKPILRYWIG
jgi:predicted acetyltransferase